MFKEFRDFALRGNVLDMAVGIIIGAAFTTIVKSLVSDIIMPPLGVLMGGVDFSNYFIALTMEPKAKNLRLPLRRASRCYWKKSAIC